MTSGRRRARVESKPSAASRSPRSRQGAMFTCSATSSIPRTFSCHLSSRGSARIASPASWPWAIAWHSWGCPSTPDRSLRRRVRRAAGRSGVRRSRVRWSTAGYVVDTREAFDRWLATGRPAFVPRAGPSPEEVIATLHGAHGVASLAHPGQTAVDARISALCQRWSRCARGLPSGSRQGLDRALPRCSRTI